MAEGLAERMRAMQQGSPQVAASPPGDARRLEQAMLLAVPDRFAATGFRAVRILRIKGSTEWFYEVVEPSALEPDALLYAQEVLRDLAN